MKEWEGLIMKIETSYNKRRHYLNFLSCCVDSYVRLAVILIDIGGYDNGPTNRLKYDMIYQTCKRSYPEASPLLILRVQKGTYITFDATLSYPDKLYCFRYA